MDKKGMTFTEFLKQNPPRCNNCNDVLLTGLRDFGHKKYWKRLKDVGGERIKGFYCADCYEDALFKLQKERFCEEYNGNTIYEKDGKYYPYWECPYYFTDIQGCRDRIDNRHVGIYHNCAWIDEYYNHGGN